MTLHSLPPEIVSSILDYTSIPELLNLCLTDKRLFQHVQPRLFHRFRVNSPAKVVNYCLLVKQRPDLALSVHHLFFGFQKSAVLPISFWKLFSQAFSCMSNITSLYFSCSLSDIIFRDAIFPRLTAFTSLNYFTSEVLKFLGRHPDITGLFLGCDNISDVCSVFLPSLRCFMGTPCVAEKLVPGRPITELALTWVSPTSGERATEIIKSFSLSSIPIRRFSYSTLLMDENRISLLIAIARYLPDLQTLHLSSDSMTDVLDQSFIESLTSLLPSFKHLRRLLVPLVFGDTDADDSTVAFHENKLSAEWKKLCPELLYIMFPSCHIYTCDTSLAAWISITSIPSESTTLLPCPF